MAQHWLILSHVYARIIKLFPKSWWEDWLDLVLTDSCYKLDFQQFTRHGDVVLFVSPFSVTVHVSNAEAIRQITAQREKFPKPWHMYSTLNMFGDNVVTTEGAVWKAHRRATSAAFSEKNSALVFREIIVQTKGMMDMWLGRRGSREKDTANDDTIEPLATISADMTRLTINVIGYVGFGLRLLWPGQSLPRDSDAAAAKYASLDAPEGFTLSFVDTLMHLSNNILTLLLVPRWLLRILPLKKARIAAAAHRDYVRYLDEMLDEKVEGVKRGLHAKEGMDLLGALAQGSYGSLPGLVASAGGRHDHRQQQAPQGEEDAVDLAKAQVLGRDEILGNAFVMLFAGHETTANTIHLTLINLATNPAAQRRLQRDIDEMVGDSDCATWDYETLMGRMTSSMVGACVNETLRIIPPVPAIPKQVTPHSDQTLKIGGGECVLPKGALVVIYGLKAHEDPRHWPYEESRLRRGHDDLRDYKPDRWFESQVGPRRANHDRDGDGRKQAAGPRSKTPEPSSHEKDDDGVDDGFYGDKPFFRPRRGAYLPFSDGPRSCLGRRVAQVEVMTCLLVLFQRHSMELATDEWASEAEVRAMDRRARTDVYRMAQAASRRTLGQAVTVITLGLQGRTVPMRLVPRGEERFVDWMT
ncbi:hypothetical protein E4U53_005896 [Claviceps sorghi]|nr:hypothetical protein E4U53_005896 [Claviceps sorghi]